MQRFPPVDENGSSVMNSSRPFRSTDYVNNNLEIPIIKSSVNQTSPKQKGPAPVGNGRARSCSGGRNKAISPPVLSRKGNCLDTSVIIDEHRFLRIMWTSWVQWWYRQTNAKDYSSYCRAIQFDQRKSIGSVKRRDTQHRLKILCRSLVTSPVQNESTVLFKIWFVYSIEYVPSGDLIYPDRCSPLQMPLNDEIRTTLDMLNTGAQQLLAHATTKEKNSSAPGTHRTEQIQFIIDDCYNIALATKSLVSHYQKLWAMLSINLCVCLSLFQTNQLNSMIIISFFTVFIQLTPNELIFNSGVLFFLLSDINYGLSHLFSVWLYIRFLFFYKHKSNIGIHWRHRSILFEHKTHS